jgi:two-component system chemotaxis response regulator CheY
VLDGVLREARELSTGLRRRIEQEARPGERVVLVVDDIDDTRTMYAETLRAAGFRVEEACNGREAIDKALGSPPDIVVTDYSMPQMDGAEAARRLAADPRMRQIPVVMISAFPDVLPREERLMCAAFLAKPCGPEELVRIVRLVLDARGKG